MVKEQQTQDTGTKIISIYLVALLNKIFEQ